MQFERLEKEVSKFARDVQLDDSDYQKLKSAIGEIDKNIKNYAERLDGFKPFTPYLYFHVKQLRDSLSEIRMGSLRYSDIDAAIKDMTYPISWSCDKFDFKISFPSASNFDLVKRRLADIQTNVLGMSLNSSSMMAEEYNLLSEIDRSDVKSKTGMKPNGSQRHLVSMSRQNSQTSVGNVASKTPKANRLGDASRFNGTKNLLSQAGLPPQQMIHPHSLSVTQSGKQGKLLTKDNLSLTSNIPSDCEINLEGLNNIYDSNVVREKSNNATMIKFDPSTPRGNNKVVGFRKGESTQKLREPGNLGPFLNSADKKHEIQFEFIQIKGDTAYVQNHRFSKEKFDFLMNEFRFVPKSVTTMIFSSNSFSFNIIPALKSSIRERLPFMMNFDVTRNKIYANYHFSKAELAHFKNLNIDVFV